jgi:hypothetical protein
MQNFITNEVEELAEKIKITGQKNAICYSAF